MDDFTFVIDILMEMFVSIHDFLFCCYLNHDIVYILILQLTVKSKIHFKVFSNNILEVSNGVLKSTDETTCANLCSKSTDVRQLKP